MYFRELSISESLIDGLRIDVETKHTIILQLTAQDSHF